MCSIDQNNFEYSICFSYAHKFDEKNHLLFDDFD